MYATASGRVPGAGGLREFTRGGSGSLLAWRDAWLFESSPNVSTSCCPLVPPQPLLEPDWHDAEQPLHRQDAAGGGAGRWVGEGAWVHSGLQEEVPSCPGTRFCTYARMQAAAEPVLSSTAGCLVLPLPFSRRRPATALPAPRSQRARPRRVDGGRDAARGRGRGCAPRLPAASTGGAALHVG